MKERRGRREGSVLLARYQSGIKASLAKIAAPEITAPVNIAFSLTSSRSVLPPPPPRYSVPLAYAAGASNGMAVPVVETNNIISHPEGGCPLQVGEGTCFPLARPSGSVRVLIPGSQVQGRYQGIDVADVRTQLQERTTSRMTFTLRPLLRTRRKLPSPIRTPSRQHLPLQPPA